MYSAARARDIESELAMTISKRIIKLDNVFDKHTSVMIHLLGTPIAPIQPLLMDESEEGISASVLRTRKVENKALQAKYRFVYGNGEVSRSSVIGTLNKLIDSPNESICLIIPEVAVVRDCDCNIISSYDLARSGFRHVQSRCGKYLFFYNKYGVFSFAAKEMGGVYYLPSAKQKLMTKMAHLSKKKVYTLKEKEELLKTWHIALRHVNVRRLIAMFQAIR